MIRSLLPLSPYEAKVAIGAMLKTHRLAANRSQRDVAGVSEATIKRIEASGSGSLEHILMVAWSLGLDRVFTTLPQPAPQSIDEVASETKRQRASTRRQPSVPTGTSSAPIRSPTASLAPLSA